ncbi:MAG TPA: DOPA 4,5-dioxygenase family protein [Alphaproteobacteria bacterium]|jgi:DOPA 4,5-dioxygenase
MTDASLASDFDIASIPGWHAHIYYDPATTRGRAERLRAKIAANFPQVRIGGWHDELVGPHTRAMFQALFDADLFERFVPFLAFNRDGLAILLHADGTGDGRKAHTDQAIWMGEVLPVKFRP